MRDYRIIFWEGLKCKRVLLSIPSSLNKLSVVSCLVGIHFFEKEKKKKEKQSKLLGNF